MIRRNTEAQPKPAGSSTRRSWARARTNSPAPRPPLFWSGLAAGLSMGFSMIAEGLLTASLPEARWSPLVAKFGYSTGS